LYNRIAEGDAIAFNELYELLKPKIVGYVMKLMKTEDAATEVIQEAMIRFWLNRDKLLIIEHPHAWLFRIIANECYRYFRQHGVQQRLISSLSENVTDSSHQTEQELAYRETRRIIQEVVQSLPPRHREVYRLSREEGLKMQEIAVRTGLSFRYVKKVLMATLKTIREKLIKAGRYSNIFLLSIF
jgi:RNA polymerase sigma-70 factor (ECF subfamily)